MSWASTHQDTGQTPAQPGLPVQPQPRTVADQVSQGINDARNFGFQQGRSVGYRQGSTESFRIGVFCGALATCVVCGLLVLAAATWWLP